MYPNLSNTNDHHEIMYMFLYFQFKGNKCNAKRFFMHDILLLKFNIQYRHISQFVA